MEIRFYNTLTHSAQTFTPLEPPNVYMYNCGPTVYDFAHIGNFRAFVFADVLRRFLELTGLRVQQVMNLTDVGHMTDDQLADGGGEDKMEAAARRLKEAKKSGKAEAGAIANPDDPYQVAEYFIGAFLEDARKLGLKIAGEYDKDPAKTHMPRATDHVGQMMKIILQLVENGHAYRASDGCVYFDVQSFPAYGKLSGNTLDKLRTGAGGRVLEQDQAVKKHPADFLLWKPDSGHIMKWDPGQWEAPWGVGYPGWHIECSAMALHVLSRLAGHRLDSIDIHTGGEDNIFPHHECEIAQTCGATGQPLFARFWMHTRFLLVDGQKMSKRKGNFYTVRDVLEGRVTGRPVDPAVLRLELLRSHYRSNMNFTVKGLEDSARAVQKIRQLGAGGTPQEQAVVRQRARENPLDLTHPVLRDFAAALADDLNVSAALAAVFTWLGGAHADRVEDQAVMDKIDSVLAVTGLPAPGAAGLGPAATGQGSEPSDAPDAAGAEAERRCRELDAARQAKDFATADRLRKELQDLGYEVMTTKAGTTARKRLA
jgi:cysteinyl-tRNA synthetase